MNIDVSSGRLAQAAWLPSPNYNHRPEGLPMSLLVVHGISLPPREFGGPWINQLFTNSLQIDAHPFFQQLEGLRVSAHSLIRRDGQIVQYVPFHLRAWHAGKSRYQGREACNDFSIGIELEGYDDIPYELAQYQALAELATALIQAYPTLSAEHIVGHCDIAPERKTDPGPSFDWAIFREKLQQCMDRASA